jgi:hypothetical protein
VFVDRAVRDAERAFLNAPFDIQGWHKAIQLVAQATNSFNAQLIGIGGPRAAPFNVISETPADPHGHLTNTHLYGQVNWRVGTTKGAGTLQHEADYAAYRALHDTSDYDDACSDLKGLFGCQMALLIDRTCLIGLTLMRSGSDGPCDSHAIDAFRLIARQAMRATRVQLALGLDAAELMLSGVGTRREATFLLDPFGQLAGLTEAAERLFDHPHGLRLDGMAPRFANADEQHSLDAACRRLFASDGISGPVLHEMRAGRSADRPVGRWRVHVVRLPTSVQGFNFHPALAVTLTPL